MSFDGPDVDNYGGDEDGHRKRDTSRKRDGKKDKKEKGYTMFEEEDSDGDSLVADDLKSPSKTKGSKPKPFKFPARKEKAKEKEEKKDKDAKKEEKEKRREEKEGKKLKKDKKKSKLHEPAVTIAAPGDYENPIFGVPLSVAVDRNKSHDGIELPTIVRECVDYIEECGLACEGIYRISGVKSKVQALKDSFNRQQPIYLYEHEPNIVASLLKQFLRDMPEPVLTTAMMPRFEEASTAKSNKKKVELFSKLIQELPACNRQLLSWMIVHMSHVIDLAKENKMTLQNVSIVLSPTMRISHRVLNILFSNVQALFGDVQLRKYVPPLRPAHSKWSLELPDNLTSLEEELAKQESLLNQLHTDLNSGLSDPVREEQLWEVQRVVTQLKRKIKMSKKGKDKDEGMRSTTDLSKRSSNASLPSLSAPEDLRLDLKPVPVPEAAGASTTTAVVVERQKSSSKRDSQKEETVTLESSKTVKFVEKPTETKRMSREIAEKAKKIMDKKIAKDQEAKQETVEEKPCEKVSENVKEDTVEKEEVSEKKEEEEEQAEVKTDQEVKEEEEEEITEKDSAIKDVNEDVKPNEDEHKESEHKTPERVEDESDKKDEKTEIPPSSVSEKEPDVKDEKDTPAPVPEHKDEEMKEKSGDKSEESSEIKPEDAKTKKEEVTEKEMKDKTPSTTSQKSVSSTTTNQSSTTTATTTTTTTKQSRVAPPPPFMSLTPLEPVKAEIPTRRTSESETTMPENEEEEWRELEEELLGKKKNKAEKNRDQSQQDQEKEDPSDDVSTEQLMEDEYALVMEEEELIAIADELRQKMATERSEMERLAQEIQELHYLRQDSDLEDMSSDSNSSDESEDEDDLQDLLSQLIGDNQDLETQNAEMCQKIHEERMICLSVKLQIRLLQQKQLEASCG